MTHTSVVARLIAYRSDWHARMGDVAVLDDAIAALSARAVMPDREAVIDAISPDVLERERAGEDSRAYIERIADAILALIAKPETP